MPPEIREAATVVLFREGPSGRELFWVRRSREVSMGGGFYAFPGGRVDAADAEIAASMGTDAPRISALRELFEETGVLFGNGLFSEGTDAVRRDLLSGKRSFGQLIRDHRITLHPDKLHASGRWITPPYLKVRFDARFFLAEVPHGQSPVVWPGELADGEWVRPADALARWSEGRALLHPPARHTLETLRDMGFPDCLARLREPPHMIEHVAQRIDFQRHIFVFPVRTPTLPPATHTNTYVVGAKELVVIDPGSPYPEEQQKLETFLRGLIAEGRTVREILLTHEHHDHVGGVTALRDALRVPVRAHRLTAERLERALDGFIEDGEVISLGGEGVPRLRAVHTPGHAKGHLCFFDERTGALITGDMVAGIGSIVIDPPEGNMSDYMASLRSLRALPVSALYPAHGPTIPDGPRKLDEYIAHREQRETQVFESLVRSGGRNAGTTRAARLHRRRPGPLSAGRSLAPGGAGEAGCGGQGVAHGRCVSACLIDLRRPPAAYFPMSARTTALAATRPKAPVTKPAVPSMRVRWSQVWKSFSLPGQTHKKPVPWSYESGSGL